MNLRKGLLDHVKAQGGKLFGKKRGDPFSPTFLYPNAKEKRSAARRGEKYEPKDS